MAGIFSIDSRILGNFNAEKATRAFRGLLWCEVRRVVLSPHRVVITLKTDIADGGVDARIDGSPSADSLLARGLTYFQLKTGLTFKPWLMKSLKKELFGSFAAKPEKDALAPEVRECLTNKDRYILVSFGYDLTSQQQSSAKKNLTELIERCGYRNPVVEVLGQGKLLGLLILSPALSLGIIGKSDLSFLTVDEWKTMTDMDKPLQLSADQKHIIEQTRDALRGTKYQHIRLIGEPGIGKTRLALESVSTGGLVPPQYYTCQMRTTSKKVDYLLRFFEQIPMRM